MAKCTTAGYKVGLLPTTNILRFGGNRDSDGTVGLPWHSYFTKDEKVVDVACGFNHSAVLCDSGNVYIFGTRFIRGSDEEPKDENAVVLNFGHGTKIILAACGRDTAFFLSDTGKVFACGRNDRGQLGINSDTNQYSPIEVTGLPAARKVSAGMCQTVVLTVDGEIYWSGHGLVAPNGAQRTRLVFKRVKRPFVSFVNVSCGGYHYAGLSEEGLVYVFGANTVGELGLNQKPDKFNVMFQHTRSEVEPPVGLPSKVLAMDCGLYHTVVLTADGSVWAWGLNDRGQLGVGDWKDRFAPARVAGLEGCVVTGVAAGGHHSAALVEGGRLFVCGRGTRGELGPMLTNLSVMTEVDLGISPPPFVRAVGFSWGYMALLVETRKAPMTAWETSLLSSLTCPACSDVVSAPIYLCSNGHSLCDTCRADASNCVSCDGPFLGARNHALEKLASDVPLPCPHCLRRMPVRDLETHACPRFTPTFLERGGMQDHVSSVLRQDSWKDLPHMFVHKINGYIETNVLSAHGELFVLRRMFNTTLQVFRAALQFVGLVDGAKHFKLELEFMNLCGDRSYVFRVDVCSDADSVEEVFRSGNNCISLDKNRFGEMFIDNLLVCKVGVLKIRGYDQQVVNIRALLDREQARS